jgi:uncharacterized phage protein (TIGR01671 family)
MGEIKFRAYNTLSEEMYESDDGLLEKPIAELTTKTELIWMQFTGLLDKKGKEIWEGDIIKKPITANKEYHGDFCYEEIIKSHGQFITSHISSEKGRLPRGYLRGFLLDCFDYSMKLFLWDDKYKPSTEIEIIGNIHENPELLTNP